MGEAAAAGDTGNQSTPFVLGDESHAKSEQTIIGTGAHIVGEVKAEAELVIKGCIEGPITGSSVVTIATGGVVHGKIIATDVVVAGSVKGDIAASNTLTMRSKADVKGNIEAARLEIEPGAAFIGKCSMPTER